MKIIRMMIIPPEFVIFVLLKKATETMKKLWSILRNPEKMNNIV